MPERLGWEWGAAEGEIILLFIHFPIKAISFAHTPTRELKRWECRQWLRNPTWKSHFPRAAKKRFINRAKWRWGNCSGLLAFMHHTPRIGRLKHRRVSSHISKRHTWQCESFPKKENCWFVRDFSRPQRLVSNFEAILLSCDLLNFLKKITLRGFDLNFKLLF